MSPGIYFFLLSLCNRTDCPLKAENYRRLLALSRTETDAVAITLRAEFRANWQLSLDCNLGGELRLTFKSRAGDAARSLADFLLNRY